MPHYLLPLLGLLAGALTTLAGQGGGLFLLLALSVFIGPHAALAITAPALLSGNLHRAWLCRHEVSWPIAGRVIAGALPGAVVGGLCAGVAPAWVLNAFLVGITVLAIAKAVGLVRFSPPHAALTPMGALVGAMTGTSGGAGVLVAPLLLSTGLTGKGYVGTGAAIAVTIHAGRLLAYGHTGLLRADLAGPIVALVVAIFAGNFAGDWIRPRLTKVATTRLEYGTLVVCVLLAVSGIG